MSPLLCVVSSEEKKYNIQGTADCAKKTDNRPKTMNEEIIIWENILGPTVSGERPTKY